MRKSEFIVLGIVALSFIVGAYVYPQLPENIVSHWNAYGQADGYMPKFWGLFSMPLISLAALVLFIFIPRIDPLKRNVDEFRKYFDGFIIAFALFLFYLFLVTIAWNIGFKFNLNRFLAPAFGALIFFAGILMENTKKNWFIGIKTPWTLSSDAVWDKTHKLGGKLFKISGAIAFLGILLPDFAIILMLAPVLFSALYSIIYSYLEYKKEQRAK